MALQLAGKRAVITGASRGIGYAIADTLAAEGADVVPVARDHAALDDAARQTSQHGHRVLARAADTTDDAADTTDDAAVRAMTEAAAEALGSIDILVDAAAQPAGPGRAARWPSWPTTTCVPRSRPRCSATSAPPGRWLRT